MPRSSKRNTRSGAASDAQARSAAGSVLKGAAPNDAAPNDDAGTAKRLDRREFLKASGALAVAAGLVTACEAPASPPVPAAVTGDAATPKPPLPQEPRLAQVPGPYEEVPLTPQVPPDPTVLEFFTLHEARTVEALAATILPGTAEDPGAREGGVLNYIDHLLSHRHGFAQPIYRRPPFAEPYFGDAPPQVPVNGPKPVWVKAEELPRYGYQSSLTPREIYRRGLELVNSYSRERFGADFADLNEQNQETVVEVMAESAGELFPRGGTGQPQGAPAGSQRQAQGEQAQGEQPQGGQSEGGEVGFHPPALREFFEVMRNHVIEGMFGDPLYGGNRDLVGWYLLGYPGAQRAYTPVDFATEGTYHRPQSIAELPHFNPGQPANEHVILPVTGSEQRERH